MPPLPFPARPPPNADAAYLALQALAENSAVPGLQLASSLLGDRAEAEDAVQEALARCCRELSRLRDERALQAWFFRVLRNHCFALLRKRRLRRAFRWAPTEPVVWPDWPVSSDRARLLAAVTELPARQRAAVVLRYGHDLPVKQVADLLGVEPGTLKTHLVRALRRLRDSLLVEASKKEPQ